MTPTVMMPIESSHAKTMTMAFTCNLIQISQQIYTSNYTHLMLCSHKFHGDACLGTGRWRFAVEWGAGQW